MRAFLFLVFAAAVLAHRHTLPRSIIAALPPATFEARRQALSKANAFWRTLGPS